MQLEWQRFDFRLDVVICLRPSLSLSERFGSKSVTLYYLSTVARLSILKLLRLDFLAVAEPILRFKIVAFGPIRKLEVNSFFESLLSAAPISNTFTTYASHMLLMLALQKRCHMTCSNTLYTTDHMLLLALW